MKDGYVQTPYFSSYLIPTVLDVPDQVQSVILEIPDPQGPWGVRGMAGMPYIPYAAAVAAAVHDATGVQLVVCRAASTSTIEALHRTQIQEKTVLLQCFYDS